MAPRRRKEDQDTSWLIAGAKTTGAFFFFSVVTFIGTWAVGLNATVAKSKEDIEILKEKEQFLSIWLVDEVRRMHSEMKEVHQELRQSKK